MVTEVDIGLINKKKPYLYTLLILIISNSVHDASDETIINSSYIDAAECDSISIVNRPNKIS